MILKKLTTGFVLMGTLLLAPAEAAATRKGARWYSV